MNLTPNMEQPSWVKIMSKQNLTSYGLVGKYVVGIVVY